MASVHRRCLCALLLAAAFVSPLRGDLIRLKSGGEIRGKLIRDKMPDIKRVKIRTLGGSVITVERAQVAFVTRRSLNVEEYETRRKVVADTLEGHWELAEWCREHRLKAQREVHLRRVIEFGPNHKLAHRGLGHQLYDGVWMSRDEYMRSQGYVRHKGRYVFPQELELIEKNAHDRAQEKAWYKKIKRWYSWATSDDPDRRKLGYHELREITDRHAVPALAKTFREVKNSERRVFYVTILSQIEGESAVEALAVQALLDPNEIVRKTALKAIRPENYKDVVPGFVNALKSDSNAIVLRAAMALGKFADDQVVPELIEALVTKHRYRVTVVDKSNTQSFAADGSGFGGNNAVVPPGIELLFRTGQLPYGARVQQSPPSGFQRKKKTTIVTREKKNREVLAALSHLTGEDYGYDQQTWRLWWASKNNSLQDS